MLLTYDKSISPFPFMFIPPVLQAATYKMVLDDIEANGGKTKINKGTVYAGVNQRISGVLGENAFELYMGEYATRAPRMANPFDFTVRLRGGFIFTIDVKTKVRTDPPRANFESTLFEVQLGNSSDVLVFLSTLKTFDKVFFCGYMSKKSYLTHPKLRRYAAGPKLRAATLTMEYQYLNQFTPDVRDIMGDWRKK